MKDQPKNSMTMLENNNLSVVQTWLQGAGKSCPYGEILCVLADAMDHAANGHDHYLVLGTTRNRDSFSLNWKGEGAPGAVYATNLAGLSVNAADLL